MTCAELMKQDVECVAPSQSARDAARKMRDRNVGFLPICDHGKKVLGTVTDRDIAIRLVAEDHPARTTIREIMTSDIVACRPQDDLSKAEQLMAEHQKSRILVIDDSGTLKGVISLSDVVEHEDEQRAAKVAKAVTAREASAVL